DPDPRSGDGAGGLPDARPAIDALTDQSPEVRAVAAHSLGDIATTGNAATRRRSVDLVVQFLVESLRDSDGTVATAAAESLGRLGADAAPSIVPLLAAPDTVAYHAANALRAMGAPVLPLLIRAAGEASTARWATVVLGEIGDGSARDIVRARSEDPDPDIRYVAQAALAKLGG
ncbi:MAG: HEAT repeat domain-containing protein, partial [Armatimonadota bacterium]